eukprot:gene3219-biopygen1416
MKENGKSSKNSSAALNLKEKASKISPAAPKMKENRQKIRLQIFRHRMRGMVAPIPLQEAVIMIIGGAGVALAIMQNCFLCLPNIYGADLARLAARAWMEQYCTYASLKKSHTQGVGHDKKLCTKFGNVPHPPWTWGTFVPHPFFMFPMVFPMGWGTFAKCSPWGGERSPWDGERSPPHGEHQNRDTMRLVVVGVVKVAQHDAHI